MPRPINDDDAITETWIITTEGTAWVWVYDRREDKYKKQRVGGRQGGSKTLHITTADRRWNQEQIVEEMRHADPFTNGVLRMTGHTGDVEPDDVDNTYHLTIEELEKMLDVRAMPRFKKTVDAIGSELVLRRLKAISEEQATVAQLTYINEVIEARYKVGGTQRTVRELMDAGEKVGGELLS